jgi:hypothetical protein
VIVKYKKSMARFYAKFIKIIISGAGLTLVHTRVVTRTITDGWLDDGR